jgi:hypothetical protein
LQANDQRSKLSLAITLQSQYARMLKEYAEFLETATNKLKADNVSASDLGHLKQQLHTHKVCILS